MNVCRARTVHGWILQLADYKRLRSKLAVGTKLAICNGMQRFTTRTIVVLMLLGSTFLAHGQAKGTLSVSAVVQTSAAWIQGADGTWTLVVANAPDSLNTFSAHAITRLKLTAGPTSVSTIQPVAQQVHFTNTNTKTVSVRRSK